MLMRRECAKARLWSRCRVQGAGCRVQGQGQRLNQIVSCVNFATHWVCLDVVSSTSKTKKGDYIRLG
jgi:hypothetical protein